MSALTLTSFFLNLASDPSDFQAFPYVTQTQPQKQTDAQVRVMANGRLRVVRSAQVQRTASWALGKVSPDQVAWLEDHVGDLMCVRDDVGRKWFGIYSSVQADEDLFPDRRGEATVTLNLTEVTYSEAVG